MSGDQFDRQRSDPFLGSIGSSILTPMNTVKFAVDSCIAAIFMLSLACCSQSQPSARNLVLISIDTLRLDRMSLYGATRDTTPVISTLAQKAVRFSEAFSPSPWTLPAHGAMLTGLYPSSLSPNPEAHLFKLAPLLSTMLKSQGSDRSRHGRWHRRATLWR